MTYLFSWAFQLIVILLLITYARTRRHGCGWPDRYAWRRLNWGIAIVSVVQLATFIRNTTEGRGIGFLYHVQWIGVYWIALATFRLRDLKREAKSVRSCDTFSGCPRCGSRSVVPLPNEIGVDAWRCNECQKTWRLKSAA